MGTTLTALFLTGMSAFWAHVGDTRIYHFHKGSLIRITEDHTIPGMLLRKGEITIEQARFHPYGNVLTRCVGCERHEPDSGAFELAKGDSVLLSTDGVHDLITDEQIAAILSEDINIKGKLNQMVSACLEAGGRDNITAVLALI
jgi:protein phosphatase